MNANLAGFVAVGLGAAVGAWLRWGLALWLNARHAQFPLGTLAANLIGAYAIGIAVAYFTQHEGLSPVWRLFVITGLLGGLTTFSTYSAEVVDLLSRGQFAWGAAVASVHLAGSLVLTGLGIATYRWLMAPLVQ